MPTTASSMVVMIIGSTRTTNDLCSVGQISGLVGVAPDLHCSAEEHEFDQYRGLDDSNAPRGEFNAFGYLARRSS
jgi:hypothetical protein